MQQNLALACLSSELYFAAHRSTPELPLRANGIGHCVLMAEFRDQRPRLAEPGLFADRAHRYAAPIALLFAALTVEEAMWWVWLQPGEVRPRVVETEPFRRVVWSSFWPVSPRDTIEFELSESDADYRFMSRGQVVDDKPTTVRFRWYSDFPPDARGIAITRQRLNRKFGGDLRAVVSEYYWNGPSGTTEITVEGRTAQVPIVAPATR
jgi:hypothetical protein